MTTLSTHVLDLVRGGPAAGVPIRLEHLGPDGWALLREAETDDDGRARGLLDDRDPQIGTFRLRFDTAVWFAHTHTEGFYPWVEIVFSVPKPGVHCHVPLLLGPYGYSTYRGS